jgi:hypothetical protein
MNKQEKENLGIFMKKLIDERLITEPESNCLFLRIKTKLGEQGTQRGLMLLAPLVANRFGMSPEDTLTAVTAILAIYGTHNVMTEG